MAIDLLGFGAHPDDVEICCAGTLLVMKRRGWRTGIVDFTRGELSTRGTPRVRAREAREASKILQLDERRVLGMRDGDVRVTPQAVRSVAAAIRELRPRVVLFPHSHDRHPDHEHAAQIVREAMFVAGLAKVRLTRGGKALPPHRPALALMFLQSYTFEPSIVVDVTPVWPERTAAVRAYRSQFHDPASRAPETFLSRPAFFEMIEGRARAYGFRIGVTFGEPLLAEGTLGAASLDALFGINGPPKAG
jgi:bacillithiol biosynthesis deacetylase BshB1